MNDENVRISSGETGYTNEMDVILRECHSRLVGREVAPGGRRADVSPGQRAAVRRSFCFQVKEEHLASRERIWSGNLKIDCQKGEQMRQRKLWCLM